MIVMIVGHEEARTHHSTVYIDWTRLQSRKDHGVAQGRCFKD